MLNTNEKMNTEKSVSQKFKGTVATKVSNYILWGNGNWSQWGGGECIVFLYAEPKMPIELIMEDAE